MVRPSNSKLKDGDIFLDESESSLQRDIKATRHLCKVVVTVT